MLSILQHVVDSFDFFLHQVAKHLAVLVKVVGDNCCRSVLTVSSTEGVVDIDISIRSELLSEILLPVLHLCFGSIVLRSTLLNADRLSFLLWIEAEVLQQQGLTRLEGSCLSVSICAVRSELYFNTKLLRHLAYDLLQTQLRIDFALRFTHVAHHDDCTTIIEDFFQCGQCATDTSVISNIAILIQWHVKVYTNNCLLTSKVEFIDCHFSKCFYY